MFLQFHLVLVWSIHEQNSIQISSAVHYSNSLSAGEWQRTVI